jgi:hypothetical protein
MFVRDVFSSTSKMGRVKMRLDKCCWRGKCHKVAVGRVMMTERFRYNPGAEPSVDLQGNRVGITVGRYCSEHLAMFGSLHGGRNSLWIVED